MPTALITGITEVSIPDLVKKMVTHDLEVVSRTIRYSGDRY